MKTLKKYAPPELKGHHKKSMVYCLIVSGIAIFSILIPTQIFDLEVNWGMAIPLFCVPFIFLIIAIYRSLSANCPECNNKMNKKKCIMVIEEHKVFGRYPYSPWNVFYCESCQKEWRIPSIVNGEGHSLSQKEYEKVCNSTLEAQK